MKQANDATKTIRLPVSLMQDADNTFSELGLTFSEGVRMYLEEIVRQKKIPFRASSEENTERKAELIREKEEAYLGLVLHRGETMLKSIFSPLVPENSKSISDEELRNWGIWSGLPSTLSLTALAELYDSGLFAKNPWSGKIAVENIQEGDNMYYALLFESQIQNIRSNLDHTHQTMLNNAISAYVNSAERKETF